MTKTTIAFLGAVALLSGCSIVSKKGGDTVTGGGGDDKPTGLAGNMAEASFYSRGDTVTAPAECHTSGYMKTDIADGEAYQIDISIDSPADTCLSVHYLKPNGGAVDGMMLEICSADSPKTLDVTGIEGGAFLQISESGVCQGATVTVAIR